MSRPPVTSVVRLPNTCNRNAPTRRSVASRVDNRRESRPLSILDSMPGEAGGVCARIDKRQFRVASRISRTPHAARGRARELGLAAGGAFDPVRSSSVSCLSSYSQDFPRLVRSRTDCCRSWTIGFRSYRVASNDGAIVSRQKNKLHRRPGKVCKMTGI